MADRLQVMTKSADQQHKEWKKGERGFVDGYVRGGDNRPYAVVVIDDRLVMIPLYALKLI